MTETTYTVKFGPFLAHDLHSRGMTEEAPYSRIPAGGGVVELDLDEARSVMDEADYHSDADIDESFGAKQAWRRIIKSLRSQGVTMPRRVESPEAKAAAAAREDEYHRARLEAQAAHDARVAELTDDPSIIRVRIEVTHEQSLAGTVRRRLVELGVIETTTRPAGRYAELVAFCPDEDVARKVGRFITTELDR